MSLTSSPVTESLRSSQTSTAFEVISDKYGVYFSFDEVDLPLKHEGPTLAYRVHATGKTYEPAVPDWMNGGRLPAAAV